ncbi:hypothetical protein D3C87_1779960 [compost metagenome]
MDRRLFDPAHAVQIGQAQAGPIVRGDKAQQRHGPAQHLRASGGFAGRQFD